jgi:uroporphyrinogen-III synthase
MSQPLLGLRIVITRAEGRGDGLAARLRELGAEPVMYPVIAYAPPDDLEALQTALRRLARNEFDWLVLTSATAVRATRDRIAQRRPRRRDPIPMQLRTKIATVGPATAQACKELLGRTHDAMPEVFTANALAQAMGNLRGQRVLLLNADIAQPTLQHTLQAAGAAVTRAIAYRTVPAGDDSIDMPALLRARAVHAILFTSGSTVRFFVERVGLGLLDGLREMQIVCIGPSTAAVARSLGLRQVALAKTATEEGLIDALIEIVTRKTA